MSEELTKLAGLHDDLVDNFNKLVEKHDELVARTICQNGQIAELRKRVEEMCKEKEKC